MRRAADMRGMNRRYWVLLGVLIGLNAGGQLVRAETPKETANAASTLTSTPRDREGAIAARLEHRLAPKTVTWLEAEGGKFPTLVSAPRPPIAPRGALMFVSGARRALDDPLIDALRVDAMRGEWLGFAVQSPLLPANSVEATKADHAKKFCARIEAALAHLKTLKIARVVLVGIDDSDVASLACSKDAMPSEIVALVKVGTTEPASELTMPVYSFMPELRQHGAESPAPAAPDRDPRRTVTLLSGADDQFVGAEEEIARHVRGWLSRLPSTVAVSDK